MRQIIVCLMGLVSLGLAGCAKNVNVVQPIQLHGQQAVVDHRILVNDRSLQANLAILNVNDAPTAGGVRHVQITLSNQRERQIDFKYRFSWYDLNGMVVKEELWQPKSIKARQVIYLQSFAPKETAMDFRIELVER